MDSPSNKYTPEIGDVFLPTKGSSEYNLCEIADLQYMGTAPSDDGTKPVFLIAYKPAGEKTYVVHVEKK